MQEPTWTEAELAKLRKYISMGWTSSAVAGKLHPKTRNAVIGKARRLGLMWENQRGPHKKARNAGEVLAKRKEHAPPVAKERDRRVTPVTPSIVGHYAQSGRPRINRSAMVKKFASSFGGSVVYAINNKLCMWPLEGKAADGNPRCCCQPRERYDYCKNHFLIGHSKQAGSAKSLANTR